MVCELLICCVKGSGKRKAGLPRRYPFDSSDQRRLRSMQGAHPNSVSHIVLLASEALGALFIRRARSLQSHPILKLKKGKNARRGRDSSLGLTRH
jgi:hypothetical protein